MIAVLAEIEKEGITKHEKIILFQSKISALEGQMYLTPTRFKIMTVSANKMRLGGVIGVVIDLIKDKEYPVC